MQFLPFISLFWNTWFISSENCNKKALDFCILDVIQNDVFAKNFVNIAILSWFISSEICNKKHLCLLRKFVNNAVLSSSNNNSFFSTSTNCSHNDINHRKTVIIKLSLTKTIRYLKIIFLSLENFCKIVVVRQNGIKSTRNVVH